MAKPAHHLRFFTDENIPDSVARFLQNRGHSVYRSKAHLPEGSADPVVATTAMEAGRILVTWDKDFNDQRYQKDRFARLSRIGLSGDGPELIVAMRKHMRIIEFQWGECARTGRRLIAFARVDQVKFKE